MAEEKKNIFEGAKLGDKFVTRDGRDAIFIKSYLKYEPLAKNEFTWMCFITEDLVKLHVHEDGLHPYNDDWDIVSRYQESNNKDLFSKEDKMKLIEDIVDYIKRFGIKESSVSQIYEHLFSNVTEL